MDHCDKIERFKFLSEAFDGVGGFRPRVSWVDESVALKDQFGGTSYAIRRVPKTSGPCHLIPHPRESPEKFAARAARAVYENHLREAVDRYVSYFGRKQPIRSGIDAPLTKIFADDCDMRGTPLTEFFTAFAMQARARGSMLLLIDLPRVDDAEDDSAEPVPQSQVRRRRPRSLADQMAQRTIPYLRMIKPEHLVDFDVDDESGLFECVTIKVVEEIDGEETPCTMMWGVDGWELREQDSGDIIDAGPNPFHACPVLAFTENGDVFPHVGKFEQIAHLSMGIYNKASHLDELLANQAFSILTLQVPENASQYSASDAVATIGTSSMLVHQGITPAFVSPDQGNAETYMQTIAQMSEAIQRVSMADATAGGNPRESGIARKFRFERLNADLATFARRMQALERAMWALFHQQLGTENRVTVEYPSDFNLVDSMSELDVLAAMSANAFPPAVLAAKRAAIVSAEFDGCDHETMAGLQAAITEQMQEGAMP